MKYFGTKLKKQTIDVKTFVEFLRKYTYEWRYFYEDHFKDISLKQAKRKFLSLKQKAKKNPKIWYADIVKACDDRPLQIRIPNGRNRDRDAPIKLENPDFVVKSVWSDREKKLFCEGLEKFGRNFYKI